MPKEEGWCNSLLFNGKRTWQINWSTAYPAKPDNILLYPTGDDRIQRETLCRGTLAHHAFGFLVGDGDTRVDDVLRQSRVVVEDGAVDVNGYACRVLSADTPRGRYRLWLAPARGCCIVRATKELSAGDLYNGAALPTGHAKTAFLDVRTLRQVEGMWLPTEVMYLTRGTQKGGDYSQNRTVCTVREITLDPDHEAAHSFMVRDLREGAHIRVSGRDEELWTWRSGRIDRRTDL